MIRKTGEVVCWGENTTNALDDGTTTQRATPAVASAVAGLTTNATPISANHGQTNCLLTTANSEVCWGTPGNN